MAYSRKSDAFASAGPRSIIVRRIDTLQAQGLEPFGKPGVGTDVDARKAPGVQA